MIWSILGKIHTGMPPEMGRFYFQAPTLDTGTDMANVAIQFGSTCGASQSLGNQIVLQAKHKLNSASDLYRPSDRCLSTKLVPTFADRGCGVISATDPYGRILGFLDRSRYLLFYVPPQLYSRGWVEPAPDPLLLRKSASAGNRTRTSGSVARNSSTRPQRRSPQAEHGIINIQQTSYVQQAVNTCHSLQICIPQYSFINKKFLEELISYFL
jgi:hypothetical protein